MQPRFSTICSEALAARHWSAGGNRHLRRNFFRCQSATKEIGIRMRWREARGRDALGSGEAANSLSSERWRVRRIRLALTRS